MKTKIGIRYLDSTFKVKRSTCGGGGILWQPSAQLVFQRLLRVRPGRPSVFQTRTFADFWCKIFIEWDALPVTKTTASSTEGILGQPQYKVANNLTAINTYCSTGRDKSAENKAHKLTGSFARWRVTVWITEGKRTSARQKAMM